MRKSVLLFILPILFQSCNALPGKLDFGNLALLFSRAGTAEISGIAMKGRIMGARVQVIPLVNNACDRTGATSAFAETTTDETGNYVVRYPKNGRPVCVLVTPSENGRTVMFDETLNADIAWTEKNFFLDSIVQEPSGPTQKGVVSSPFSRMTARVFAKTMEKADPSFAAAVANASSRQVVAMFGLNKGFVRSEPKNRSLKVRSPNAHPRSFGRRAIPEERLSSSRSKNGSARAGRNTSNAVVPTLEELGLDFTKPDDPLVATTVIKLSGISALANGFANRAARSIEKGLTTRSTANGDALELVIDGFSQVIESGGRRNTILAQVITQATGRPPSANFSRNPLEASMQTGIASFVQTSPAAAAQFNINVDDIDELFSMSSTPPTSLIVDTGSAPDYLYYADNNDAGALVLRTNTFEDYYPYVEGGLPTQYEVRAGTLPPGMSLNPVTGQLSGTPTTATTATQQITIRASNLFGSTSTVFRIRVQSFVVGQASAYVYNSTCTQSTTCNLDIGIEGISNYNITGFTSTAGTFRVTNGILGTITGTAGNVSGARKGTLSYTNVDTGASATIAEVDFVIDPSTPTATVWASELVQGFQFSYVAFEVAGVGEFGTYSFVPQDFGNGMTIDRFGAISGSPTTSGAWSPTITVINSSGQRFSVSLGTLTIGAPGSTPVFVTAPPPVEDLTLLYSGTCIQDDPNCNLTIDTGQTFLPSGVTLASLTFSDSLGELSTFGLSIAPNGTITGTPNTSGPILANITGIGSDSIEYDVTAVLLITPPAGPTLAYPFSPFSFTVSSAITAAVGAPAITQNFATCNSSPTLPPGITLNSTTCALGGSPTTNQSASNYTITGTNANGTVNAFISIAVTTAVAAPSALAYTGSPFTFTNSSPISPVNPTFGGGTPTSFSVSPALPSGLSINTSTGVLSGTPTTNVTSLTYTVSATNSGGTTSVSITITVNTPVAAPSALTYSAASFTFSQNVAIITQTPTFSGTVTTCSSAPSLPAGLTINNTTCAISGTPTVAQVATNHTITATNAGGSTTVIVNITVVAEPVHTLYVSDSNNGLLYYFNTGNSGSLSSINTVSLSLTGIYDILWNEKHIVVNGGNIFQSYLRNSTNGSLAFTTTYTGQNALLQGTVQFNPTNKFFYYPSSSGASLPTFTKINVDTNGGFTNETNTGTGQFWTVMGPIHPSGNYFMTFHISSTWSNQFVNITDTNLGTVAIGTGSNIPAATTLYPDAGQCIYSLNGNHMYCANMTNMGNNGTIVQMSVTSSSLTLLSPGSFLVQDSTAYQSPKSLVLHPTGNWIFAYGNTNIYSYSVNQSTGVINTTPVSVQPLPGSCPTNGFKSRLAIHPSGNMLYAACVNTGSNSIGAYPISSGVLSGPTLSSIPGTTNAMYLRFVPGTPP